jgi:hypothetical protein
MKKPMDQIVEECYFADVSVADCQVKLLENGYSQVSFDFIADLYNDIYCWSEGK